MNRKGALNLLWNRSAYLFIFYINNTNIYIGAKLSLYNFHPHAAVSQLTSIERLQKQCYEPGTDLIDACDHSDKLMSRCLAARSTCGITDFSNL